MTLQSNAIGYPVVLEGSVFGINTKESTVQL